MKRILGLLVYSIIQMLKCIIVELSLEILLEIPICAGFSRDTPNKNK